MARLAAFMVISVLTIYASGQRHCYSCNDRERPQDCENVATCSAGEQCITDKFISEEGHTFFNLGCRPGRVCQILNQFGKRALPGSISRHKRNVIHLCTKCCDSDYCNKDLCADSTPPPTVQNQCYKCDDLTKTSQCEFLETCEPDEVCFSEEYLNDNGEFRINLGCQRKVVCDALSSALKNNQQAGRDTGVNHLCNACCRTNHCNLTPCKNITNAFVAGRR
ncbi:uncharacterized protein [Haliotis asinina]|uniref:uncharacterized protein n=1 Tax=Haliotis asinina TaxID=109174 RepID=UPI003531DB5D